MNNYEISLWKDYLANQEDLFLSERKIAVIGGSNMTSQNRAVKPVITQNKNGSHVFTFTLYYQYIDNTTGEEVKNPYVDLIFAESKIKVRDDGVWYDFVVKQVEKNSTEKSVTYTCQDLFITELSKNGFNLEYSAELKNSIGTLPELAEDVLSGTDWTYDGSRSVNPIERTKDQLYAIQLNSNITGVNIATKAGVTVTAGKIVYAFYSYLAERRDTLHFLYDINGNYEYDDNASTILNEDVYQINGTISYNGLNILCNGQIIGTIPTAVVGKQGYDITYAQQSVFDSANKKYLKRYLKNGVHYAGLQEIEFSKPDIVGNLIVNSNNFSNTTGWKKAASSTDELSWIIWPAPSATTEWETYDGKGYLRVNGKVMNDGLHQMTTYLPEGISEGQEFVFRYKIRANDSNAPGAYLTSGVNFAVSNYTQNNGIYIEGSTHYLSLISDSTVRVGDWVECRYKALIPLTKKDLTVMPIGMFLTANGWVEEIEFFKYAESEKIQLDYEANTHYYEDDLVNYNDVLWSCVRDTVSVPGSIDWINTRTSSIGALCLTRCVPGKCNTTTLAKSVIRLCPEAQLDLPDAERNYSEFEILPTEYTPLYEEVKYRSLVASKTNRFNLLQTLAELFQCWIHFDIQHESNGAISKDDDGKPIKYVYFTEQAGKQNGLTFTYGLDLQSIQRQIDSAQIVTKTIVTPNRSEFADDGICSIAGSDMNYPRTSYVMDFGYYTQQGLIDGAQINKDLYSEDGYYSILHKLNLELEGAQAELSEQELSLIKIQYYETIFENALSAANDEFISAKSDIIKFAGYIDLDTDFSKAYNELKKYDDHTAVLALYTKYAITKQQMEYYDVQSKAIQAQISAIKDKITELKNYIDEQITLITEADEKFFKKYSRFILEGSWTSSEYYDNDKYFLDARSVAYESSRPKITYTIQVAKIAENEDYKYRKFMIGDICNVQDTSFFGYVIKNNLKTPYKEPVVISQIIRHLDDPTSDQIQVQNYKTKFDDLFQAITATTQSLQYNEGGYKEAANAFDNQGSITYESLQNSLATNNNLVYSSQNDSIIYDATGILISDLADPNYKTKITSKGLFISTDGGLNWKNAIRGAGIATQYLTSGTINTELINLMSGSYPTFRWDKNGINSYRYDNNGVYSNTFIRLDQYGLYGLNNYSDDTIFVPSTEQEIWDNASFGLTWRGFFLKTHSNTGAVTISTDDDILVTNNDNRKIKIGRLDTDTYGIQIYDDNENPVFETKEDGNVYISGAIRVGGSDTTTTIGPSGSIDGHDGTVLFNSNNKFIIWDDGTMRATDGIFTGEVNATSGRFNGEVIAQTGSIGGWTIGDNTLTSADGNISLNSLTGTISGANIEGATGSFTGEITATSGKIGDFTIDASGLNYTNDDTSIILNGSGLNITNGGFSIANADGTPLLYLTEDRQKLIFNGSLETIDLSSATGTIGGWSIRDNRLESTSESDNHVSIIGEPAEDNIFLTAGNFKANADGRLYLGDIVLDGSNSNSYGIWGNGFHIAPNNTWFDSLDIGTLNCVTNKVQTIGGISIFNPTFKLARDENNNEIKVVTGHKFIITDAYDFELDFTRSEKYRGIVYTENSTDLIYVTVTNMTKIMSDDIDTGMREITVEEDLNAPYVSFIYVGTIESGSLIAIANVPDINKSSLTNVNLPVNGFSVNQIIQSDGVLKTVPKVFLGNLNNFISTWGDEFRINSNGYGLYCDDVFLRGSLTTKIEENAGRAFGTGSYAGINTVSGASFPAKEGMTFDDSRIVFWAGAEGAEADDIRKSKFLVSERGSLMASQAYIEGSIITNSTLYAASIATAIIRGYKDNQDAELQIKDAEKGIGFYSGDTRLYKIGPNGFFTSDTNSFIEINGNTVDFVGNNAQLNDANIGNLTINANLISEETGNSISLNNEGIAFSRNGTKFLTSSTNGLIVNTDAQVQFNAPETIYQNNNISLKYQQVTGGYNLYVVGSSS